MRIVINIDVPELESAISFYTGALGLTLSGVIDEDVAELTGAFSVIYLLAKTAESNSSSSAKEVRRYTRHWTPVHIDFVVEDIVASAIRQSTLERFRKVNVSIGRVQNASLSQIHLATDFALSNSRAKLMKIELPGAASR